MIEHDSRPELAALNSEPSVSTDGGSPSDRDSATGDVAFDLVDHVAVVELRRPPSNFFNEGLLRTLADTISGLDEIDEVRSIVLCSEGKHFCAGADLRGMDAKGIRRIYRQAFRLFTGRKPIIAALQGSAVGGGLGLALAADFRIASPDARLIANFARLGFHQGFGLSATLPALIGQQNAKELLYTGHTVTGTTAKEINLCDATADDPRRAAVDFGRAIAESAPLSVQAIRSTLRRNLVAEVQKALEVEADAQIALLETTDFAEGLDAAICRRSPRFVGA